MSGELTESERVRRLYDRLAPRYDQLISITEPLLFGGGRAWACGQAHGDVLEVAVGTGRDLPFYPAGVRLTAVDVSENMLAHARRRASDLDLSVDLRVGTPNVWTSPTRRSTRSSRPCRCAASPTTTPRSLRWLECFGQVVSYASSTTWVAPTQLSTWFSDCSTRSLCASEAITCCVDPIWRSAPLAWTSSGSTARSSASCWALPPASRV